MTAPELNSIIRVGVMWGLGCRGHYSQGGGTRTMGVQQRTDGEAGSWTLGVSGTVCWSLPLWGLSRTIGVSGIM